MYKYLSKRLLIPAFLVLLLGVVLIQWLDSQKEESTYNSELVKIDTAAVTEILLNPKSLPELRMFKEQEVWMLESGEQSARVEAGVLPSLLAQLHGIKPLRLAAKGSARFDEFQLSDSLATRVRVSEGTKQTLDLLIGKFDFQQQTRATTSFVRLYGSEEVYAVDGFLSFTFNQKFEQLAEKPAAPDTLATDSLPSVIPQ